MNFLLEIALFTFLGILYYFYQKRKLKQYEDNKGPIVMGFILNACLLEKKDDRPAPALDVIIEALDDYLHNRVSHPPIVLLKKFSESRDCSSELESVITEGLKELDS